MFLLSISAEHPHRLHGGCRAAAHAHPASPPRRTPSPGSPPAAETLHWRKFRIWGNRMMILNTNEASCHFCGGFFGRKVFSALQPCPQHLCVRRWGQRCASCLHGRSVRARLIPVPAELPCPGGSALSRGQSPALAEELLPEELEVSEEQQEGLRVRGPNCQPRSGARLSPLPRRCLFATGRWATARGTPSPRAPFLAAPRQRSPPASRTSIMFCGFPLSFWRQRSQLIFLLCNILPL